MSRGDTLYCGAQRVVVWYSASCGVVRSYLYCGAQLAVLCKLCCGTHLAVLCCGAQLAVLWYRVSCTVVHS